jgi:hypothetical protein
VIDAELGREDHCSIPCNCDWELKILDARTDPEPDSTGGAKTKKKLFGHVGFV